MTIYIGKRTTKFTRPQFIELATSYKVHSKHGHYVFSSTYNSEIMKTTTFRFNSTYISSTQDTTFRFLTSYEYRTKERALHTTFNSIFGINLTDSNRYRYTDTCDYHFGDIRPRRYLYISACGFQLGKVRATKIFLSGYSLAESNKFYSKTNWNSGFDTTMTYRSVKVFTSTYIFHGLKDASNIWTFNSTFITDILVSENHNGRILDSIVYYRDDYIDPIDGTTREGKWCVDYWFNKEWIQGNFFSYRPLPDGRMGRIGPELLPTKVLPHPPTEEEYNKYDLLDTIVMKDYMTPFFDARFFIHYPPKYMNYCVLADLAGFYADTYRNIVPEKELDKMLTPDEKKKIKKLPDGIEKNKILELAAIRGILRLTQRNDEYVIGEIPTDAQRQDDISFRRSEDNNLIMTIKNLHGIPSGINTDDPKHIDLLRDASAISVSLYRYNRFSDNHVFNNSSSAKTYMKDEILNRVNITLPERQHRKTSPFMIAGEERVEIDAEYNMEVQGRAVAEMESQGYQCTLEGSLESGKWICTRRPFSIDPEEYDK